MRGDCEEVGVAASYLLDSSELALRSGYTLPYCQPLESNISEHDVPHNILCQISQASQGLLNLPAIPPALFASKDYLE